MTVSSISRSWAVYTWVILEHHSTIFMLKGTKVPGNQIREELEITLKIIMNKLHKLKSWETQIDKLNFFLAQKKVTLKRFITLQSGDDF